MKVNELRIGNLIKIKDKIGAVNWIGLNDMVFVKYKEGTIGFAQISQFEGIPITDQWLLENFVNNGKYNCGDSGLTFNPMGEYYYPVLSQSPEMANEEYQLIGLNRIQYIHELQNLYFTLRGEELIKTK